MAEPANCPSGKHRHATRVKADRHLKRLHQQDGGSARVYSCPLCGGFHVGHRQKTTFKNREQRSGH